MSEGHWGLRPEELDRIREVLAAHSKVSDAVIYGSRATGTQRAGSDIDLTLRGKLAWPELQKIEAELDGLELPYTIDLSIESQIENPALREHIQRYGETLYTRDPART